MDTQSANDPQDSTLFTCAASAHAHHAPDRFIRKYIFSLDHKVIGLQYFFWR